MRLLLLKICVCAMYFIIGCSQLQVSGEFVQPKQLLEMKQEDVIRPGYYSYNILKEPEKSITEDASRQNGEWEKYIKSQFYAFPKKYNDLLKSPVSIFKILHKLASKSESLEGKQSLNLLQKGRKIMNKENNKVVKSNYNGRFPLKTLTFLNNNSKKQDIIKYFADRKEIGFANYLERIIRQHSAKTKTTTLPKINFDIQREEIHEWIPKIRKVRDILPSLIDFKSLQNAIKATTYFEFYKDGNISSFEHFNFHTNTHNFSSANNTSRDTSRLIRSNTKEEELTKKKSAVSKFLFELQNALETVKFLTEGMFYPKEEDNDEILQYLKALKSNTTKDDKKVPRTIRQLSEENHSSISFKKKLIEMEKTLNQLTESIAQNRCSCMANPSCGLERKIRETERENCGNYEEVAKIVKNLNSLLRDFVDTSVGDLEKNKNFDSAFMKLSDIKLKKFQSELHKLRKQLSSTS